MCGYETASHSNQKDIQQVNFILTQVPNNGNNSYVLYSEASA